MLLLPTIAIWLSLLGTLLPSSITSTLEVINNCSKKSFRSLSSLLLAFAIWLAISWISAGCILVLHQFLKPDSSLYSWRTKLSGIAKANISLLAITNSHPFYLNRDAKPIKESEPSFDIVLAS